MHPASQGSSCSGSSLLVIPPFPPSVCSECKLSWDLQHSCLKKNLNYLKLFSIINKYTWLKNIKKIHLNNLLAMLLLSFVYLSFFFNTYNDMNIFSKPPIFLHKINILYVLFPPLFWLIYLRDLLLLYIEFFHYFLHL